MVEIRNDLIVYQPVREGEIISEKAAYELIKGGKFNYYYYDKNIRSITVKAVTLGYSLDTKGYFQPVYEFIALFDEQEVTIVIPALQSKK